MTTWPGRVVVGDHDAAEIRPMAAATAGAIQPDDGAHAALDRGGRHQPTAQRDEPQRVLETEHPGRHQGRVLAHRVPRHAAGRSAAPRPASASSSAACAATEVVRRHGCVWRVSFSRVRRTVPGTGRRDAPAQRAHRRASKTARAAGERSASDRPMPDRLRTLGREEERDPHPAGSSSTSSWPYSTGSPASVTRLRTVPPRGARTS